MTIVIDIAWRYCLEIGRDIYPIFSEQNISSERKWGHYVTEPPYIWSRPLTRYVKFQVAHARGMPGTFSPTPTSKKNRQLATPACITVRASRTCHDACRDRLPAGAFPAHAQPTILRIWYEAHTINPWIKAGPKCHVCSIENDATFLPPPVDQSV